MSEIVAAVVITFAVTGLLSLAGYSLWRWLSQKREASVDALNTVRLLAENLQGMREALASVKESLSSVPVLVAGLTEVSKVQVKEMEKLVEVVSGMRSMLFSGDDSRGYIEYNEKDASREYKTQEMMRTGDMGRKEAEGRLREEDVYRNLRITR